MKRLFTLSLCIFLTACQQSSPPIVADADRELPFDVVLNDGTVVDGLGNPRFQASIGIKGDRMIAISESAFAAADAEIAIDATGLIVSPGFIDNHAHVQTTIHKHPLAENFTRQGITTLIAGLHSGDQPWPLDEYAMSLDVAPNVGFFAGHTWTRKQVMGLANRAPGSR